MTDAAAANRAAKVEMEQRLIGWQLVGAPGAVNLAAAELSIDATSFEPPHDRIQGAIFEACDAGRAISPHTIAAQLSGCLGLDELGGAEYLRNLAYAAPTTTTPNDVNRQMHAAILTWRHLSEPLKGYGAVELVRADAIEPINVDWLWPGWLARGKLHLLAGGVGTGKTTLSLAIAATISMGGEFPDGSHAERGTTLLWSGEDDAADSLVPRFLACGGDRKKLYIVTGSRDGYGRLQPFDPAVDMAALLLQANRIKDLKFVIIDPVVAAVAGDSHKNAETRHGLQPLVDLAAKQRAAALGITHFSKATTGREPAERVTGSLAFVAVPRLVMVTAKPKQQGDPFRVVRAKSNVGPAGGGFEYDLQQTPLLLHQTVSAQRILWGAPLEGAASELLAEVEALDVVNAVSKLEEAKLWLADFLSVGAVPMKEIELAAAQMGHAMATIRRAKKELGVEAVKSHVMGGGWLWALPKALKPFEDVVSLDVDHLITFEDAHPPFSVMFEDDHHPHADHLQRCEGDREICMSGIEQLNHLHWPTSTAFC